MAHLALPAVEYFGGRFWTRSTSQIQPHKAGLPLRTALVAFDSFEIALAAYTSRGLPEGALGSRFRRGPRLSDCGRRVSHDSGHVMNLNSPLVENHGSKQFRKDGQGFAAVSTQLGPWDSGCQLCSDASQLRSNSRHESGSRSSCNTKVLIHTLVQW